MLDEELATARHATAARQRIADAKHQNAWADCTAPGGGKQQLDGPAASAKERAWDDWLGGMLKWRHNCRKEIAYTGALFDAHPGLAWASTSYLQPQMHPFDLFFYNRTRRSYTIDKYLDDLDARLGGIDSVLVWPTYPNIGMDDRNQFDMMHAMPGGAGGMRDVTRRLQARGVRVLWPLKPWDKATRRDEVLGEVGQMTQVLAQTGADGLNGDTFPYVGKEYWDDALLHGLAPAIEPELGGIEYDGTPKMEWLNWHAMSWGYWDFPKAPLVAKYKWLETRHMTHVCDRWQKRRLQNLQAAYFNGVGFEVWENVWGTWNGFTPRAAEATRRVGRVLRYLGAKGYLTSKAWVPHTRCAKYHRDDIFGSSFPHPDGALADAGDAFFALVNRGDADMSGPMLVVPIPAAAAASPIRFIDVFAGVELVPTRRSEGAAVLAFGVEAQGFGGLLVTSDSSPELAAFMASMRALRASGPLSGYSDEWKPLLQTMEEIPPTAARPTSAPPGMVRVPPVRAYTFETAGLIIEPETDKDMDTAVDVQFPWERHPSRQHKQVMSVPSFYMDTYPVTCDEYARFLEQHRYAPPDATNFLKTWHREGERYVVPEGHGRKPVTHVSLNDARAFCRAYGKRLPHAWEWQYAGQGTDRRKYPWGDWEAPTRFPKEIRAQSAGARDDVDAHPTGASPFGVMDMVGNVWQYTDVFSDTHTRAALVRGGSNYKPFGDGWSSQWYYPQAKSLVQHNKYYLMDDSYERAATLGFRCVQDAPAAAGGAGSTTLPGIP